MGMSIQIDQLTTKQRTQDSGVKAVDCCDLVDMHATVSSCTEDLDHVESLRHRERCW